MIKPTSASFIMRITLKLGILCLLANSFVVQAEGTLRFWNGNKSNARQSYEHEILIASLNAVDRQYKINEDKSDYPGTEESEVFDKKGFDVFVTVAGNLKLEAKEKIVVHEALMKGLLGHRLIIIRNEDKAKFTNIDKAKFKTLNMGIPATWADAELFRVNGYGVVEKGTYDEIFTRLKNKEFDYVALGANEIEEAYAQRVSAADELMIEPGLLLYYPFPLVFYVNPNKPELATDLIKGLKIIQENGEFDKIFQNHTRNLVTRLKLKDRKKLTLSNPILPAQMHDFNPNLID